MNVDESEDPKVTKIVGVELEFLTPGDNADKTACRGEAMALVQKQQRGSRNARQTILMYKEAHWSSINWELPTAMQVQEAMEGHDEAYKAPIYGMEAKPLPRNGGQC